MNQQPRSVLVTGATGFTGGHLCRRLRARGDEVSAFVRSSSDTRELERLGVVCRVVDIRDRAAVRASFGEYDQVYHVAAAYRGEHADREEFVRVNVEATRNLLEAARHRGVGRFVHCSTVGVQGGIDQPPADEDYRTQPGDHYQQSKLAGELLARRYFDDGLPGVVVRPVGIYGPGDTRFLKLFRAVSRRKFVMIGNGATLYHMTYIDDLVEGFLLAAQAEGVQGEVFTIAGPRYTSLGELVAVVAEQLGSPRPRLRIPYWPIFAASVACDRICRSIGVSPPLYPRRVEFFSKHRAFSIDKARRLLGYEPSTDLREGFARTAAWYQQQRMI